MSMHEALLQQKIEFLEIELEEYKRREEDLRAQNDSLMNLINNPTQDPLKVLTTQDQTIEELKKSNEQYSKDLSQIKQNYKDQIAKLEKSNYELALQNKELNLDLRQFQIQTDSEKYELRDQIKKLESDKLSLENSLKSYQHDSEHEQSLSKYQFQLKLHEAQRELEIQKEEARKDCLKIQQEADSAIIEIKSLFNKENEALRQQIRSLQQKVRQQSEKIHSFKELEKSKYEEEKSKTDNACQTSFEEERTEDRPLQLRSHENTARGNYNYSRMLNERTKELKELQKKNESLELQRDRAQIELDKATLELKQIKLQQSASDEKRVEIESKLKNEIKFLIGKLLKAKSKRNIDLETIHDPRNRSMKSSRITNPLETARSTSPMNLSTISRHESPFINRGSDFSIY